MAQPMAEARQWWRQNDARMARSKRWNGCSACPVHGSVTLDEGECLGSALCKIERWRERRLGSNEVRGSTAGQGQGQRGGQAGSARRAAVRATVVRRLGKHGVVADTSAQEHAECSAKCRSGIRERNAAMSWRRRRRGASVGKNRASQGLRNGVSMARA